MKNQTLFDKYGGVPVVTNIVRDFYKRVLRRPQLRRYFVDVDREHLIQHQIAFVSMALGKPPTVYTGRDMRSAHTGIKISKASFDLTVELFADVLRDNEVSPEDVTTIVSLLKTFSKDIVGR